MCYKSHEHPHNSTSASITTEEFDTITTDIGIDTDIEIIVIGTASSTWTLGGWEWVGAPGTRCRDN